MLTARRGESLAELLVAMVLLGIIGAATAGTLVQQGRVRTRVVWRLATAAQMQEAAAPILADLGAASPAAADLDPMQATDTSLALRITMAEGFVCAADAADSMTARVVLLAPVRGRNIAAGDSAWWYRPGQWAGAAIERVAADDAGNACGASGTVASMPLRITIGGSAPAVAGSALRITRRVRYSFYRAGDGETYLGLREWSAALGAFAGQQPVAGPLARSGSGFSYVDSLGNVMLPSAGAMPRLALVGVELTAPTYPWRSSAGPVPRLSAHAALRNRR